MRSTVPLTDANLNAYLRLDDGAWNWGSVPVGQRGTFGFALLPDALGVPDRVIAATNPGAGPGAGGAGRNGVRGTDGRA